MKYKRLLLKLSGESLMGDKDYGIDQKAVEEVAKELKKIQDAGHELALVIGGGNIFRGIHYGELGIARAPADQMGMLATVINGIALVEALKNLGSDARLMSGLECPQVAEPYTWQQANDHLAKGKILIFGGGTGSPYFTTDTAAALRACEIGADLLLKATKVDGIYDSDPVKHSNAKRYSEISYSDALKQKLEVMDATAFALCMSGNIPLFVFNMERLASSTIEEIVSDHRHGTFVKGD